MEQEERILGLALEALYSQRQKIDAEIAKIEEQIGVKGSRSRSHRLSAAGRKAISEAMKRRWAKQRATKGSKKRQS